MSLLNFLHALSYCLHVCHTELFLLLSWKFETLRPLMLVLEGRGQWERGNLWVAYLIVYFQDPLLRRKILPKAFNNQTICYTDIRIFFLLLLLLVLRSVAGPTIPHKLLWDQYTKSRNLFNFLALLSDFNFCEGDWELGCTCTWFWYFPKVSSSLKP